MIAAADREGLRLPGRRRRLLRRHQGRRLRQALQPRPGAAGGRRRASRSATRSATPATSPCGRAPSRASRQCSDSPWGPGRPGWHIECSVHEHEAPRRDARHPRRRPRPAVPAPRERAGPERSRTPASRSPAYWMHNGLLKMGNGEDGRLGRQRRQRRRRCCKQHQPATRCGSSPEHALPLARSTCGDWDWKNPAMPIPTGWSSARSGVRDVRPVRRAGAADHRDSRSRTCPAPTIADAIARSRSRRSPSSTGSSASTWTTTSTPAARSACCSSW